MSLSQLDVQTILKIIRMSATLTDAEILEELFPKEPSMADMYMGRDR
jgi:hypothetical protein